MPANMKKAGIKYKVGGSVMKKAQVGGEQNKKRPALKNGGSIKAKKKK